MLDHDQRCNQVEKIQ